MISEDELARLEDENERGPLMAHEVARLIAEVRELRETERLLKIALAGLTDAQEEAEAECDDLARQLASDGVKRIAAERQRQIEVEGWSPKRDRDLYQNGQLAAAAVAYALVGEDRYVFWPWDALWWKPGDRIRELEKAGALIAAEIDRLLVEVPRG